MLAGCLHPRGARIHHVANGGGGADSALPRRAPATSERFAREALATTLGWTARGERRRRANAERGAETAPVPSCDGRKERRACHQQQQAPLRQQQQAPPRQQQQAPPPLPPRQLQQLQEGLQQQQEEAELQQKQQEGQQQLQYQLQQLQQQQNPIDSADGHAQPMTDGGEDGFTVVVSRKRKARGGNEVRGRGGTLPKCVAAAAEKSNSDSDERDDCPDATVGRGGEPEPQGEAIVIDEAHPPDDAEAEG
ncbi:unnamed protein product [Lampetra fluviatilis]